MVLIGIILLIVLGLGYGAIGAHHMQFGFVFLSLKYPYYNIGLSFRGHQIAYANGEVYNQNTLTFGLLFIEIWIAFYTKITPDQIIKEEEDDIAIGPISPAL